MPEYGLDHATQFELPGGLMLLKGVRESGVAAETDYLDAAVEAGLIYVVDPDAPDPEVQPVYDALYVERGTRTGKLNRGGGVLTDFPLGIPTFVQDTEPVDAPTPSVWYRTSNGGVVQVLVQT